MLPNFKYHPDPLSTGSIVESSNECECCGEQRGFIYSGPAYASEEYVECICPWCISSGLAHSKLEVDFTDYAGIGGYGRWDEVERKEKEVVTFQNPGFSGWQQERWWTHCGQPGAFLGVVGNAEISKLPESLAINLQAEAGMNAAEWEHYKEALDKNGSPAAYAFKCTVCDQYGGYSDCD